MICRLCLKDIIEAINIFDEIGAELNVAAVLSKYFWFEPKCDDPISTAICNSCWISVSNFNEFYLSVEEAHRLLTERYSLSTESGSNYRKRWRCLIKNEEETENESSKSITELTAIYTITPNADTDKILQSHNNKYDQHILAAKTESCSKLKLQKNELLWNDDERSLNSETLMEEVLSLVEESEDALAVPLKRKLRSGRSNTNNNSTDIISTHKGGESKKLNNLNATEHNRNENESNLVAVKKRRGRPPKTKIEIPKYEAPKIDKTKFKRKSTNGDNSQKRSYEERMRQIDEKISQCIRLSCDICALEQPTFSQLRKHMEKMHQCKGYAICCNKKFNKRALLVGHIEKHLNPDCYRCDSCDKTFADKQCMRNHFLIKHQPDEEKQYQCEHCPKRFARPYILEQHRMMHEERKHICDVCNKGFATSNLLSTHIKTMHSNHGGTMCDVCAKVIRGRTAFARHQLEHTGIVLPKVQCDKCGSWHKDKYSLQKHKRRHNDDGTVHVCNICAKVAPNRSALLSHQRYVHRSVRSFECSVCKKAFKKAITLKEHMAMHTGEVLYSCPHCPKTFNSNANMHSHRKKMHPKEFEETRKKRREDSARPEIFESKQAPPEAVPGQELTKLNVNTSSDEDSLTQVMIIKSDDGRETHNILTTEAFSDDEDDINDNENSIVFTLN